MEIKKETLRNAAWIGLLLVGLVFVLASELRVTQSTTILFGDEGTWASVARFTAQNLAFVSTPVYTGGTKLYVPYYLDSYFYPLLSAGFFKIGGESLVKASSPLLAFLTGLLVFLFVRRAYSLEAGVLSALLFVAVPSFITYSVLVYVDVFATLLVVASLLMLYRGLSEGHVRCLVASGILWGMATLTKESGFLLSLVYLVAVPLFGWKTRRELLQKYVIVFGLFVLVITPWYGVHNYLQYGVSGIPVLGSFVDYGSTFKYTGSGSQTTASFSAFNPGGGTEADIVRFGFLNYASFAYSVGIFFLALVGFSLFLYNRSKINTLLLVFTVVMLVFTLYVGQSRAENAARFALPTVLGVAAAAGFFLGEVYARLRTYGKLSGQTFAAFFVVFVVVMTLSAAETKAASLAPIKVWPKGFYDGCDWIRENTPLNARFMTLWASRAGYHCQRDFYWNRLPDFNDIVLGDPEVSYQKLKAHGIDYIYIQKFSISFEPYIESYPLVFLKKLLDPEKYEKVYENTQYDAEGRDLGVIVVKVK